MKTKRVNICKVPRTVSVIENYRVNCTITAFHQIEDATPNFRNAKR